MESFPSFRLSPAVDDDSSSSKSNNYNKVTTSDGGKTWHTSSFYLDSSGRSSVGLTLQLTAPDLESFERLVSSRCFDPFLTGAPDADQSSGRADDCAAQEGVDAPASDSAPEDTASTTGSSRCTFGIEAKVALTFGTGEAITASVEDVVIGSAEIIRDGGCRILLDTSIIVRVTRPEGSSSATASDSSSRVKTVLEVSAVLTEEGAAADPSSSAASLVASPGLAALNLGGFANVGSAGALASRLRRERRVQPFDLTVVLTHALSIAARGVLPNSQTMGRTLVSLTIRHSNTHPEPVTITNIALHPGHSVEQHPKPGSGTLSTSKSPNGDGGNNRKESVSVSDMSKIVKWTYAPQCDPNLPLQIAPNEAFSTIISVDATEDRRSRTFASPISVTACVGTLAEVAGEAQEDDGGVRRRRGVRSSGGGNSIVVASQVNWTTCRAAVEPSDAFRLDMTLDENEKGVVGSPMTVHLEISNLSTDSRDLMVLVDNTGEVGKTAVLSEVEGSKFGVWGLLAGVEDGVSNNSTVPAMRAAAAQSVARELLTVDVALLVGELKGSASKKASLRFIPLKEGTLSVPNLKLYDRRRGRWYTAVHNVRLVVEPASS